MTYFYKHTESLPNGNNLYTVGYEDKNGKWHPDSDWNDQEEAAQRAAFLNGNPNAENPKKSNKKQTDKKPKSEEMRIVVKARYDENSLAMTHAACLCNITRTSDSKKEKIGHVVGIIGGGVEVYIDNRYWTLSPSDIWDGFATTLGKKELAINSKN